MIFKESFLSIILILVSIYGSNLLGQNYCKSRYDNVWILGGTDTDTVENTYGGCEINFNTTPPSLNRHPKAFDQLVMSTSMSSEHGDLIFYSNGCLILNALDEPMENGDLLNPGYFYEDFCPDHGYIGTQSMFVLPDSYLDSIYYLFHINKINNSDTTLPVSILSENLYCTTIDMSGDNGLGAVRSKNVVILRDTTMMGGPLTATKHANGMDWWIINPNRWTNSYNLILVDEDGPQFIGRQYVGIVPDVDAVGGQGKFSPDGSKFAWYYPAQGLYLYDFDRLAGELSNFEHIEIPAFSGIIGGLEFSPSGNFLYLNHDTSLFQIDLLSHDLPSSLTHIADYDYFVDITPTPFFYMQRTPDHRIIMSPLFGSQWLHVIHEPDKKGKACRFEQHTLKLPTLNHWTLPHFPNYRLGPLVEPLCDSLWVSTDYPEHLTESKYRIGPNPTSGYLQIFQIENGRKEHFEVSIIGMNGSLFLQSNENELDLSGLPAGVYICKIVETSGFIQIDKIVVLE